VKREMQPVVAHSINGVIYKLARKLANQSAPEVPSRAGTVRELHNVNVLVRSPRHRHVYLKGRKNDPFAACCELWWILAGKDSLEPVMAKALKRAYDFSDDGLRWHDAYGPRLMGPLPEEGLPVDEGAPSPFDELMRTFRQEGLWTRRGVVGLWNQATDTISAFERRYSKSSRAAIPCNNMLYFYVRPNRDGLHELHCHVTQRSADLLWGLSHVNMFAWTVVQEIVQVLLTGMLDERVSLGQYTHSALSVHGYGACESQVNSMAHANPPSKHYPTFAVHLPVGMSAKEFRMFAKDVYCGIAECAEGRTATPLTTIRWAFINHGVPLAANALADYAYAAAYYMAYKAQCVPGAFARGALACVAPDFWAALNHSPFKPWRKL